MFKALGAAALLLMVGGGLMVASPPFADAVREESGIAPAIRGLAHFDGPVGKTEAETEARAIVHGFTSVIGSWSETLVESTRRIGAGENPTTVEVACDESTRALTDWANELLPTEVVCYAFVEDALIADGEVTR